MRALVNFHRFHIKLLSYLDLLHTGVFRTSIKRVNCIRAFCFLYFTTRNAVIYEMICVHPLNYPYAAPSKCSLPFTYCQEIAAILQIV